MKIGLAHGLSCRGDAAETPDVLPDLDRWRAFGEPPRGGQGSAIGDAEDAVAGNDVVGCVKLIEAILGHRGLLGAFSFAPRSAWSGRWVALFRMMQFGATSLPSSAA
jgi:hypothetical protein